MLQIYFILCRLVLNHSQRFTTSYLQTKMSRVQFHSCYKFHFLKSPVLKFQFCQEPVTTPQISTHQFNRLLMAPENRWRWMTRFLACTVRRCAVENGHDLDLSVNHYRIRAGSVTRLCWSTANDAISAEKTPSRKALFVRSLRAGRIQKCA